MRVLVVLAALAAVAPATAQPKSSVRFKLDEVQATLAVEGLDGWLLVNNRRANPVAIELVNPSGTPAHEWFFLIPASGTARALVHAGDQSAFASTGAQLSTYENRTELRKALKALLKGTKRVAAEYAPKSKIAALTRIDPATAALIRKTRVKLVSSAKLVQFSKSLWGPKGRVAHYVAAHHLGALRKQALAFIRTEVEAGRPVTEYDVQQLILKGYKVRGIGGGSPAVAAGPNTSDPTYMPSATGARDIARGDLVRLTLWARLDWDRPIYANITWMAFVGDRVPNKYRDAFAAVAEARDSALALIRDRVERRRGVRGWEPARAARDVLNKAGFAKAFTHRTGHSLDTSVVGDGANLEDFAVRDDRLLVRGSGFTIEPGVYFAGDFGLKSEINVFIGTGGVEVTTDVQKSITPVLR